ncbi:hypothetical protein FRC06_003249 [Ceratobasidium sp. 370]|nr:hypothetical protein FRC06_003249 [Ceratobasidium sp. 370]
MTVPAAETDVIIRTIPLPPGSRGQATVWKDALSFFPMHGYSRDEQKAWLGFLLRGGPMPDDLTEMVQVETDTMWVWQSTPSIFSTGNVPSALQLHSAVSVIEFSDMHQTVAVMWEETAKQDVVDLGQLVLVVTQPTVSESAPDQTALVGGEPSQQGGTESPNLGGLTQLLQGAKGSTRPSGRRRSTLWEGMEVDRLEQGGSDATPPPGWSSTGSSDHEVTQSWIH